MKAVADRLQMGNGPQSKRFTRAVQIPSMRLWIVEDTEGEGADEVCANTASESVGQRQQRVPHRPSKRLTGGMSSLGGITPMRKRASGLESEMERLMGLEPTTFRLGSEKTRTQQAQ